MKLALRSCIVVLALALSAAAPQSTSQRDPVLDDGALPRRGEPRLPDVNESPIDDANGGDRSLELWLGVVGVATLLVYALLRFQARQSRR